MYVEVRPSKIHGLGLFAIKHIPARTVITYYDGERISRDEAKHRSDSGEGDWLCTTEQKDVIIDGLRTPIKGRGMGSFCNHSNTPNSCFKRANTRVDIVSKFPVSKGSEIFVDYGNGYWRRKEQLQQSPIIAQRFNGFILPTHPSRPKQIPGCAVKQGVCNGCWFEAVLQHGKLSYLQTDNYERAYYKNGELYVFNGNKYTVVPHKNVNGKLHVWWDDSEIAPVGESLTFPGGGAISYNGYLAAQFGGSAPVLLKLQQDEHVCLKPGCSVLMPFNASSERCGVSRVFGDFVRNKLKSRKGS